MKLVDILKDVIQELKKKNQYSPENFGEESLYESYIMLSELFNPANAYPYKAVGKGLWEYIDSNGNEIYVRIMFQPISTGEYFEVKTWWMDQFNRKIYDEVPAGSSAIDWDKRTDTIAKIFKDEIIPLFKNQDVSNVLKFLPITKSRFVFASRMVKKFIPSDWEIEEIFPKEIIIRKPGD